MRAMFHAAFCQKLHTDTDPERGPPILKHRFGQGFPHAGQAIQPRETIAKCPNPGQNDSIGAAHKIRIARDNDVASVFAGPGGALNRLRDRAQIA